jgi:hypothetical protein
MPLLGSAALAMWWDMTAPLRSEFEDWHSHEHFHERMRIPGFLRGSRWESAAGDDGFFVMYELESYDTLTSPGYLASLNNPTPWSTKMMPHHRNMIRSQCSVARSHGGGIGSAMMTLRLSPAIGRSAQLQDHLLEVLSRVPLRPGLTGGHLLHTRSPGIAKTTEERIRGGDAVADWIVLASGYETAALRDLATRELDASSLVGAGALPEPQLSFYRLSYAMTPNDLSTPG